MRRAWWFVARPNVRGVLTVPVTPEGKIVLVRLTYDKGWHLPGGGHKKGEAAEAEALRELREEIGLKSHGEVTRLGSFEHRPDWRHGTTTVFLVRDVRYEFRPSLEIEEVGEYDPDALPDGVTPITAKRIEEALLRPA